MSSGTGPVLARPRPGHRAPGRCRCPCGGTGGRPPTARAPGSPGGRAGDHLGRDGPGHRGHAIGAKGPAASLRSRPYDVSGGAAGAGRRDRVVPHHRPRPRRRHQGQRRPGDHGRDPPRRLGAQRPRHRRLGREVLLPGRAERCQPGGRARPLRVGCRLRGPGRLLGRVHPQRDVRRPVARRDRFLAAGPARDSGASTSPTAALGLPGRIGGGRLPDRSTSTSWDSSTSSSTSACCTT